MKLIFVDFFRRAAWIYGLATIIAVIVFALLPVSEGKNFLRAVAAFGYAMLFSGPIYMAYRLQQGFARVIHTMPVSRSGAARALWLCGVGAPSAYMMLLLLAALLVQVLAGGAPVVTPSSATLFVMLSSFYIGSVFFILTQMPGQAPQDSSGQVTGTIVGGLWGLSIGGGVFVLSLFADLEHPGARQIIALMVGGILTILGWFQSERMLQERARPRLGEGQPGRDKAMADNSFSREGLAGLSLLLKTSLAQSIKMSIILLVMMFLVNSLLNIGMARNTGAGWQFLPQFYFMIIPILFGAVPWLSNIRHLRTLPLSDHKLMAIIAFLFLVPLVIFVSSLGIILYLVSGDFPMAPWRTVMLLLGIGVLAPGVVLKSGSTKSLVIVTMVFVPVSVLFGGFFAKLSLSLCVLIASSFIATGLGLIYSALMRSSRTYRPTAFARG